MLFNYGYGGKICVVDRKENKQRNFAEIGTKYFVRSHDKNATIKPRLNCRNISFPNSHVWKRNLDHEEEG